MPGGVTTGGTPAPEFPFSQPLHLPGRSRLPFASRAAETPSVLPRTEEDARSTSSEIAAALRILSAARSCEPFDLPLWRSPELTHGHSSSLSSRAELPSPARLR